MKQKNCNTKVFSALYQTLYRWWYQVQSQDIQALYVDDMWYIKETMNSGGIIYRNWTPPVLIPLQPIRIQHYELKPTYPFWCLLTENEKEVHIEASSKSHETQITYPTTWSYQHLPGITWSVTPTTLCERDHKPLQEHLDGLMVAHTTDSGMRFGWCYWRLAQNALY